MKLEKAFTREHMEALLAWNYILSQSCLQMNIFWLLTQSTHRTGAGNKRAVWTVLYALTQVPVCEWWHLRNIRQKRSGCDLTRIIKLAENQIIKWVCLDNQSFWLTEKRNCLCLYHFSNTFSKQITLLRISSFEDFFFKSLWKTMSFPGIYALVWALISCTSFNMHLHLTCTGMSCARWWDSFHLWLYVA